MPFRATYASTGEVETLKKRLATLEKAFDQHRRACESSVPAEPSVGQDKNRAPASQPEDIHLSQLIDATLGWPRQISAASTAPSAVTDANSQVRLRTREHMREHFTDAPLRSRPMRPPSATEYPSGSLAIQREYSMLPDISRPRGQPGVHDVIYGCPRGLCVRCSSKPSFTK